jgi:hypothetical protein
MNLIRERTDNSRYALAGARARQPWARDTEEEQLLWVAEAAAAAAAAAGLQFAPKQHGTPRLHQSVAPPSATELQLHACIGNTHNSAPCSVQELQAIAYVKRVT